MPHIIVVVGGSPAQHDLLRQVLQELIVGHSDFEIIFALDGDNNPTIWCREDLEDIIKMTDVSWDDVLRAPTVSAIIETVEILEGASLLMTEGTQLLTRTEPTFLEERSLRDQRRAGWSAHHPSRSRSRAPRRATHHHLRY